MFDQHRNNNAHGVSLRALLASAAVLVAVGAARPVVAVAQATAATPPPTDYSAPPDAPYTAEAVSVPTPSGIMLAGTLTLPKGASREHPVGAIVTITGTGPQDRDEYLGLDGFRPFRQIADSLGRRGVAVLRMDDRGSGAHEGTSETPSGGNRRERRRVLNLHRQRGAWPFFASTPSKLCCF